MKTSELRIGNVIISNLNGLIGEVFTLGESSLKVKFEIIPNVKSLNINEISPLKINKEILINFGFKETATGQYSLNGFDFQLDLGFFENEYIIINVYNPTKFVHQLQNLYYAVTGVELSCA